MQIHLNRLPSTDRGKMGLKNQARIVVPLFIITLAGIFAVLGYVIQNRSGACRAVYLCRIPCAPSELFLLVFGTFFMGWDNRTGNPLKSLSQPT
jgi:hypothetical protein